MLKPYLFTPSEFAFGLSGCKKCYYDLKINKIKIQTGFPQIFSKLDSIQKEFYHNKSSELFNSNEISKGIIKTDYLKLQTSEVMHDNKGRSFQLRGKIDAYVKHDNFYSIVDFKVTNIDEKKIERYKTQLFSYALMFENPNEKSIKLKPIKNLGIFCFEPKKIVKRETTPFFEMKTKYFNIKRNDKYFFDFITSVMDFLEEDPPDFNQLCDICNLKRNKFF